jgi:hypothetical protein
MTKFKGCRLPLYSQEYIKQNVYENEKQVEVVLRESVDAQRIIVFLINMRRLIGCAKR